MKNYILLASMLAFLSALTQAQTVGNKEEDHRNPGFTFMGEPATADGPPTHVGTFFNEDGSILDATGDDLDPAKWADFISWVSDALPPGSTGALSVVNNPNGTTTLTYDPDGAGPLPPDPPYTHTPSVPASDQNVTDTNGLAGAPGGSVTLQDLIDAIQSVTNVSAVFSNADASADGSTEVLTVTDSDGNTVTGTIVFPAGAVDTNTTNVSIVFTNADSSADGSTELATLTDSDGNSITGTVVFPAFPDKVKITDTTSASEFDALIAAGSPEEGSILSWDDPSTPVGDLIKWVFIDGTWERIEDPHPVSNYHTDTTSNNYNAALAAVADPGEGDILEWEDPFNPGDIYKSIYMDSAWHIIEVPDCCDCFPAAFLFDDFRDQYASTFIDVNSGAPPASDSGVLTVYGVEGTTRDTTVTNVSGPGQVSSFVTFTGKLSLSSDPLTVGRMVKVYTFPSAKDFTSGGKTDAIFAQVNSSDKPTESTITVEITDGTNTASLTSFMTIGNVVFQLTDFSPVDATAVTAVTVTMDLAEGADAQIEHFGAGCAESSYTVDNTSVSIADAQANAGSVKPGSLLEWQDPFSENVYIYSYVGGSWVLIEKPCCGGCESPVTMIDDFRDQFNVGPDLLQVFVGDPPVTSTDTLTVPGQEGIVRTATATNLGTVARVRVTTSGGTEMSFSSDVSTQGSLSLVYDYPGGTDLTSFGGGAFGVGVKTSDNPPLNGEFDITMTDGTNTVTVSTPFVVGNVTINFGDFAPVDMTAVTQITVFYDVDSEFDGALEWFGILCPTVEVASGGADDDFRFIGNPAVTGYSQNEAQGAFRTGDTVFGGVNPGAIAPDAGAKVTVRGNLSVTQANLANLNGVGLVQIGPDNNLGSTLASNNGIAIGERHDVNDTDQFMAQGRNHTINASNSVAIVGTEQGSITGSSRAFVAAASSPAIGKTHQVEAATHAAVIASIESSVLSDESIILASRRSEVYGNDSNSYIIGTDISGSNAGKGVDSSLFSGMMSSRNGLLDNVNYSAMIAANGSTANGVNRSAIIAADGAVLVAGENEHLATTIIKLRNAAVPAAAGGYGKIYVNGNEVFAMDAAGNSTQLTSHPDWAYDKLVEAGAIERSLLDGLRSAGAPMPRIEYTVNESGVGLVQFGDRFFITEDEGKRFEEVK